MYRPTNPQISILSGGRTLPEAARLRLARSWADHFAEHVFPVLLQAEDKFKGLYEDNNGRPNWSVARILGVMLLQEMSGLTDQEALDALSFDLRWQRALDVTVEDAYLSRRSLVAFRARISTNDQEGELLRHVFKVMLAAALADLKLSVAEQRLDSTQIVSNIRTRGRTDLFAQTLSRFCRELKDLFPGDVVALPTKLLQWVDQESQGGFGWQGPKDLRERLQTFAGWLVAVRDAFQNHAAIRQMEAYELIERLVAEHLTVTYPPVDAVGEQGGSGGSGGGSGGSAATGAAEDAALEEVPASEGQPAGHPEEEAAEASAAAAVPLEGLPPSPPPAPVEVKIHPVLNPGQALQSPHDPDAGYGHKGQGYSAQITETCHDGMTRLITDYDVHSAGISDMGQASKVLVRLDELGIQPGELSVDAGYVSGGQLLSASAAGVELRGPVSRGALSTEAVGRDEWVYDAESGRMVACPEGNPVEKHRLRQNGDHQKSLHAYVSAAQCKGCPLAAHCMVRGQHHKNARFYYIEDTPELLARDRRLTEQKSPDWRQKYRIRSGSESTISELKRKHRMGRLRVRRLPRVRIAVATKVIACNVKRWSRAHTAA